MIGFQNLNLKKWAWVCRFLRLALASSKESRPKIDSCSELCSLVATEGGIAEAKTRETN